MTTKYRTGDDQFDSQYGGLPTSGVFLLVGEPFERPLRRAQLTVALFRLNRVNVYTHVSCADLNGEFMRQHAAISGQPLNEVLGPVDKASAEYIQNQVKLFTRIERNDRREYSFTPLRADPDPRFILDEPLPDNKWPWIVGFDYDDPYWPLLRQDRSQRLDRLRHMALTTNRLVLINEDRAPPRSAYEDVVAHHGRRYLDRYLVDLTRDDPFVRNNR